MNSALIIVLVGNLTVTSYRSVTKQTDSTPFRTSTNERVSAGGVAVSRDLLCGACRKLHHRCKHPEYKYKLHYGDWLYVKPYGFRRINDCMGSYTSIKLNNKYKRLPITNQIDIWVSNYQEEKVINISQRLVFKVAITKGETYEPRR